MSGRVGEAMLFEGFAENHDKRIVAIEFSLDEQRTWTRQPTPGALSDKLVHWTFSYTPREGGIYRLFVRSVNEEGKTSPVPAQIVFEVL